MKRSVERIEDVTHMDFDLSTGQLRATYKAGATVRKAALWKAITKAGFTPVKIEIKPGTVPAAKGSGAS